MKIATSFVINYLSINKLRYSIHNSLDQTNGVIIKGEFTDTVPLNSILASHPHYVIGFLIIY